MRKTSRIQQRHAGDRRWKPDWYRNDPVLREDKRDYDQSPSVHAEKRHFLTVNLRKHRSCVRINNSYIASVFSEIIGYNFLQKIPGGYSTKLAEFT